MKIHFSIKSIPELSDLPDEWRHVYWSKYKFKAFFHWKTLMALFICLPVTLKFRESIPYFIDLYPYINRLYIELPLVAISSIFWIFIVFNVHVWVIRKYLSKDRTISEKRFQITSGSR